MATIIERPANDPAELAVNGNTQPRDAVAPEGAGEKKEGYAVPPCVPRATAAHRVFRAFRV